MKFVEKVMDCIAKNVLKVVMLIMGGIGLIIKSMYGFDDCPYFELWTIYDYCALVLVVGMTYVILKNRDWLQLHLKWWYMAAFFIIVSIIYVLMVPVTPFSDMEHVFKAALNFSRFDWSALMNDEYWKMFPGNIYLGAFWGILLIPLPKTLISIKILNILFAYGAIYFTVGLCRYYKFKYYSIMHLYLVTFLPLILYTNHVYFDLPVLFLCCMALYINAKYNNLILSGVILGIARYLRMNVIVIVLAIVINYVFHNFKLKKIFLKNIAVIIAALFVVSVISNIPKNIIHDMLLKEDYPSYPAANQFYIGLNEEKFGFMDGDFSYTRTMEDVIDRIQEYGPVRMTKILFKKTFWLWTQGTYQAQRYAFGLDTEVAEEKFEYPTCVEKYLLKDSQKTRKMINAVMRAQYLLLFYGMIFFMWKKKDISKYRVFYYSIIAVFIVMMFYELKSRYILICLPMMAVMACGSLEELKKKVLS